MLNQNGQCIFDGDGPALQHSLCVPTGVAVLPSGDVFVVDSGNIRIREISAGTMTTIVGNGIYGFGGDGGPATAALLNHPTGVAADNQGAVYISDTYNNRIRRLTAAAATTTALVSSPNPSNFGQTVLLTAKVTASSGTPTGNLTFYDGPTPLRTVEAEPASYVCSCCQWKGRNTSRLRHFETRSQDSWNGDARKWRRQLRGCFFKGRYLHNCGRLFRGSELQLQELQCVEAGREVVAAYRTRGFSRPLISQCCPG
jgi:hypothetical protein